jgi:hypothetical protein
VIAVTYIDEAGTHGAAPHMVMGALVGRLGQWAYFDKKWRKMLRRNGITCFHSKRPFRKSLSGVQLVEQRP